MELIEYKNQNHEIGVLNNHGYCLPPLPREQNPLTIHSNNLI
jgi:hypothetical protein